MILHNHFMFQSILFLLEFLNSFHIAMFFRALVVEKFIQPISKNITTFTHYYICFHGQ